MFTLVKLDETWYAVFLVNPNNEKDRYMMTNPVKKHEAEHFLAEFIRIQNEAGL